MKTFKKDDFVKFKPEFQDPGDDEIGFRCIDDEEKGRVTVMALLGFPVNPTQVVDASQLELDNTEEETELMKTTIDPKTVAIEPSTSIEQMEKAYQDAIWALENLPDLEITSALKQAASDCGIPYGPEMGRFVRWANAKMGI